MNRRSLLRMLGLAPVAAPVAARAALVAPAAPPMMTKGAGGASALAGATFIDGDRILAGSITADRIVPGSISIEKLGPHLWRDYALTPHASVADRLEGALSFGA